MKIAFVTITVNSLLPCMATKNLKLVVNSTTTEADLGLLQHPRWTAL